MSWRYARAICPRCECRLNLDGDWDDSSPTAWCSYCGWPDKEEE